jgi:hypothetical protein
MSSEKYSIFGNNKIGACGIIKKVNDSGSYQFYNGQYT